MHVFYDFNPDSSSGPDEYCTVASLGEICSYLQMHVLVVILIMKCCEGAVITNLASVLLV